MFSSNPSRLPDRDRLGVLVGMILLGLVVTQFIQLPSQQLGTTVLGSPLGLEITGYWMLIGVLAILASAGADMLIRSHPQLPDGRLQATFINWILPALSVLVAGQALLVVPNWPLWWTGLLVTGVLFGSLVTAQYMLVGEKQPAGTRPRLFLNVMAYVLSLALYAAIYSTRGRSLITATAAMLLSFLVALQLLWAANAGLGRTALLAASIGLVLGECSWMLNYWRASVWLGSLLLLLVFYTLSGLAAQHLLGKLSRPVLLEFGLVAAIGLALLIVFHP